LIVFNIIKIKKLKTFSLTNSENDAIIYLLSDRELIKQRVEKKFFKEFLKKVLTTLKESDIILKLSSRGESEEQHLEN